MAGTGSLLVTVCLLNHRARWPLRLSAVSPPSDPKEQEQNSGKSLEMQGLHGKPHTGSMSANALDDTALFEWP